MLKKHLARLHTLDFVLNRYTSNGRHSICLSQVCCFLKIATLKIYGITEFCKNFNLFKFFVGESKSSDEDKGPKQHISGIQSERAKREDSVEDKKKLRRSKKHRQIEEPVDVGDSQKKSMTTLMKI